MCFIKIIVHTLVGSTDKPGVLSCKKLELMQAIGPKVT